MINPNILEKFRKPNFVRCSELKMILIFFLIFNENNPLLDFLAKHIKSAFTQLQPDGCR